MNRKNGLQLQREGGMGELPAWGQIIWSFCYSWTKNRRQRERGVWRLSLFKEIGFLFKGSAQPKHKKDVWFFFSPPLTCNGIQPRGKFCFYSVLLLRYPWKIQYNGDDYNFVWGAQHIENIWCRNSALIALNDPRPRLWTVFTGTTSAVEKVLSSAVLFILDRDALHYLHPARVQRAACPFMWHVEK